MKNYRVKVRDDKAEFFEELLRYLDFLDYEKVEGFSEPRIYSNFEISDNYRKKNPESKTNEEFNIKVAGINESSFDSLREVMQKIDARRDSGKKQILPGNF